MRKTFKQLEMHQRKRERPRSGTRWRHNKTGNHYKIVGNSFDCDTNEFRVHYINIPTDFETPSIEFSRPHSQWEEQTEFGPRFSEVKETTIWISKDQQEEIQKYNKGNDT